MVKDDAVLNRSKKKNKQKGSGEGDSSNAEAAQSQAQSVPGTSQTPVETAETKDGADKTVEKEPPKVESVPEQEKQEKVTEADEGLGLGIGGGKRRPRRKKPMAAAAATGAATTPTAGLPETSTSAHQPEVQHGDTAAPPGAGRARSLGAASTSAAQQIPPAFAHPQAEQAIPPAFGPQAGYSTGRGRGSAAFGQRTRLVGAAGAATTPTAGLPETSTSAHQPQVQHGDTAAPPGAGRAQFWKAASTSAAQQIPPAFAHPQAEQAIPPAFGPQAGYSTGRGRGSAAIGQRTRLVGAAGAATTPTAGLPETSTSAHQPQVQHGDTAAPPGAGKPGILVAKPEPTPTVPVSRLSVPAKIPGGVVPAMKTRVVCNYLEMKIQPIKVHRYDVLISPDRPKRLLSKVFAQAKALKFPKQVIAFDQRKNCYSMIPLWKSSDERCSINVEILDDNNVKMAFEVCLKKTGIVDLGTIIDHMKNESSTLNTPSEAIQCVDVILQQGTLESYVKVGRQFFRRPRNPIDLSSGLEMWNGLFQSAIFTSRAFINIDVAHKGFPRQQNLIDTLLNDFNLNPKQPLDRQRGVDLFIQFIKGLRVKANIGGTGVRQREFICNELVDPPNRMIFQLTDASGKPTREISVLKYFEVEKKCRILYPNLNCLWVGPKEKKIYYPIELLEVVYGQAIRKQLNEKQLSTMVREAATPPSDRLNKIKEVIRDMNYSANPGFKHFKLEIDNKFFQVDAKILEAPKIDIGTGRSVEPRRGVWQANRFLRPSALESWGFIAVDVNPNYCNCDNVIQMIMQIGRKMGMGVNVPALTKFNVSQHELKKLLLTAQGTKLNFMFIVVSGRDKDAYHKIKRMAELEVGILTQCIKEMTVSRRMNEQTVRNILLKVNSKLMGINQALDTRSVPQCLKSGGVMIVGADVTHPSPDQMNVPSIAAVTASIDPKCFIYHIEMSIQTPKNEIIVDFENMMFDHLKIYKNHQRCLPKKIFVFRDGVSEGQYSQVMKSELVAVHKAYARHDPVNKPEILFMVVQKRHHTRFFMGEQNPQNVEPGTVVDTHIVHPKELEFYMVSHQAIKGTARPTRYHAVCNDGNIPVNEVEQLTYYLCHLYSRCTRAVSYPTPTYYAHLACFRAKSLTFGERYNNSDLDRKPIRLRVLDRMLECSRMFFV